VETPPGSTLREMDRPGPEGQRNPPLPPPGGPVEASDESWSPRMILCYFTCITNILCCINSNDDRKYRKNRQTDSWTDTQADRWTDDRHTGRQMDRRQTHRQTDGQTTDTDRCTDDRQMRRQTEKCNMKHHINQGQLAGISSSLRQDKVLCGYLWQFAGESAPNESGVIFTSFARYISQTFTYKAKIITL